MTPESKRQLRHFEIVDCAVRSPDQFYLMASHVYQLDEDSDDDEGESVQARDPEPDLREAIRVAVYFTNRPDDKKWAFRTLRNIEFMKGAVADAPAAQLVGVSLDGQVFVLGSGVSEFERRIDENKAGPLRGSVRQVLTIDGHVYAVQGNRGLCRRVAANRWESLCTDLPVSKSWRQRDSAGFTSAAGTSSTNIYCGGGDGDLWHFDGKRWTELHFPSNVIIETLCCASSDDVYVGCQNGIIYRGSGNTWKKISEGDKTLPYRSMIPYRGKIWCSSDYGIWTIDGEVVAKADVPSNVFVKAGVLSARDNVLLVAGSNGAAYFDGTQWHEFLNFL